MDIFLLDKPQVKLARIRIKKHKTITSTDSSISKLRQFINQPRSKTFDIMLTELFEKTLRDIATDLTYHATSQYGRVIQCFRCLTRTTMPSCLAK